MHVGDVIRFGNNTTGVVFYINPERTGGWVVKSTDIVNTTPWAPQGNAANTDILGIPNRDYSNLLTDVAGYANTELMRTTNGASGSHAAGLVGFNNGWYVPAAGQLRRLYGMLPILEGMGIPANLFTTLNLQ